MATVVEIHDDDGGVDWAEVKKPYPHFFKVLFGDYFTNRMKIPPNFIKNLEEDMTSNASSSLSMMRRAITASIEGPSGRTWYVELEKKASGVFFTTGWSNFARDHSLKERELLIFRYNGYMSFTVLIFDKTSCEKNLDNTGSGCERRTVRLKPRKLAFDEDELGDRLNAKEKSVLSTERNVTEVETEEEEEENAVEPSFHKRKKALEKRKSAHWRLSKIPPVMEKKLKVQEDADSFVSENPFFVICLNASDVNRRSMPLRLPIAFSRKYMPRRKTDVILRVSANCKTWPVVFQPYEDERDRLSRGWTSFASDNSLKECDCCTFELVKPAEFLVHIFRVSKVQLPILASRATMKTKDEPVPSTEPKITETDTEDEEMNPVQNSSRKRKKASERSKSGRHRCSSRLHPVTEMEKQATEEAAHSFASENPFFVVCLNASAVYGRSLQLKLPVELSKRHLPRHKTDVILHVSANSKTWSVGFLPYVAQKDRLSRGWSSFVSDNSLEEYDYCAFELVKSAEFLVHIFRVSEVL